MGLGVQGLGIRVFRWGLEGRGRVPGGSGKEMENDMQIGRISGRCSRLQVACLAWCLPYTPNSKAQKRASPEGSVKLPAQEKATTPAKAVEFLVHYSLLGFRV